MERADVTGTQWHMSKWWLWLAVVCPLCLSYTFSNRDRKKTHKTTLKIINNQERQENIVLIKCRLPNKSRNWYNRSHEPSWGTQMVWGVSEKQFWNVWMPKIFKVDLFWPGKILCIFVVPAQRSKDLVDVFASLELLWWKECMHVTVKSECKKAKVCFSWKGQKLTIIIIWIQSFKIMVL